MPRLEVDTCHLRYGWIFGPYISFKNAYKIHKLSSVVFQVLSALKTKFKV